MRKTKQKDYVGEALINGLWFAQAYHDGDPSDDEEKIEKAISIHECERELIDAIQQIPRVLDRRENMVARKLFAALTKYENMTARDK